LQADFYLLFLVPTPAAYPERAASSAYRGAQVSCPGASAVHRCRDSAVAVSSAARADESPEASAGVGEDADAAADSVAPAASAATAGVAGAAAADDASSNHGGQTTDGRDNSGPNSRRD